MDVAKAIDLELKGDIENCLLAVGETLKPFYLSIALHAVFHRCSLRCTIPFKT